MRNMLLVLKYELVTTLSKPSFWLTTFLIPLLVVGMNVGSQLLIQNATKSANQNQAPAPNSTAPGNTSSTMTIAYVDEAGLIQRVPPEVPADSLQVYPSRKAAQAALESGKINQYYVIPADFVTTGKVIQVVNRLSIISGEGNQNAIRYLLGANLVDDPARAAAIVEPLWSVEGSAQAPQQEPEPGQQTNTLTTLVPLATIMIFFFVLTFTGSFMLQSVTREKENRTAEVLLVSLRPRELMMGKVLAFAVVGLAQMVIWVGGGLLVLGKAKQVIATAQSFALPAGFFVWGLLYFLLGYLLYASAMAGLGALAPGAREGNQVTFVAIVPLMIPLMANVAFSEAPNGLLATFLSLFPLTSPVSMVTRLAVGQVPFWQPVAGLVLLAATVYLIVLLAGRLFRADTLLSSSAFNWRRVQKELKE